MLTVWVLVVWLSSMPGSAPVSVSTAMTMAGCEAARRDMLMRPDVLGATCVPATVPAKP